MSPTLPRAPAAEQEIQLLRESLHVRWQVGMHTIAPFLVLCGAVAYVLRDKVPPTALHGWCGLLAGALLVRAAQARFMVRRLQAASLARLRGFERQLTASTMLLNGALGAGFWLLALPGDDQVRLLVTLGSCLYSVALLAYQAIRFAGYVAGMLCNLLQAVAFWIVADQHDEHLLVAAMLAALTCTAVHQARLTAARFRRVVLDRMHRRVLTAQLARDKRVVEGALAMAHEAAASKAAFMAAASHDLRQPVHALSLFVQTLAPLLERTEQQRLLGRIRHTADALETMFTNLLELSRLDAGAVAVQAHAFDLDALVARLRDEFAPLARRRGLDFAARAEGARADCDALLLERVLRNLLSNAIDHTAHGAVRLTVQPLADGRLRIVVADTGTGMAARDQARAFDEFVRLDDPHRPQPAGFGLGLAIVRRLDRLLGLDLRMRSAPGYGTRVELTVPAAAPASPTAARQAAARERAARPSSPAAAVSAASAC